MRWQLSSSSDKCALAVVDGLGSFAAHGPHYSRRTPGSKTFTSIGQEIVLVTTTADAVWSVVYQQTPQRAGSGSSRGRAANTDDTCHIWRNNVFRNLGRILSSELIVEATARTYEEWLKRYGSLPVENLRTEIDTRKVRSSNPGFCYLMAGWRKGETRRHKLHLWAPERKAVAA